MDSRKWLIVALVACGLASACSDYNTNLSIQTSSSTLTFVSPSSANVGGQGFTITANGTGFTTGALILWNGTPLTTTLVSSIQLTAPVPSSDLTTPGTVQISIQIPGSAGSATNVNNTTTTEISNIVLFTVSPSPGTPPAITSLSASTTSAASTPYCSSQPFTLTVNGTNFTSDAVVVWNGTKLSQPATTVVSPTQLTAQVPAALAAFPGTVAVTVTNSVGTSAATPFTLSTPSGTLPAPTLVAVDVSPSLIPAGSPSFTLTPISSTTGLPANALVISSVNGSTFLPCTVVEWTSSSGATITLPTEYIPAAPAIGTIPAHPLQLNASVPSSLLGGAATSQTAQIFLSNPPPAGTQGNTSKTAAITIAPPKVTSVSASTTSSNTTPSCSTSGFTLTVNGANFVSNSVINWNNSPRATTFVSATQVTAPISAADIASAGTASITVTNTGVPSNSVPFTISASTLPAATISAIAPGSATAGTPGFPLVITGTGFLPCSSVQWVDTSNNVTQLATSYVSSTQLSATVAPANLTTVETVQVSVANPASSANLSNAMALPILLPTITGLSASSTSAGSTPECAGAGITLTVNGTNFVASGLTVNWNGSPRATTFVSPTQLTAAISAVDTAFAGSVNITVSSTAIPTLASNSATLTIVPSTTPLPVPAIATLLPSNTAAGSAAFTMGVDASGPSSGTLSPCSIVNWNGTAVPTTFNSSSGLNAAIPASDVAVPASVPVTVSTLTDGGGGGKSNALTFTVFTPPAAPAVQRAVIAASATPNAPTNSGLPALPMPTMSADHRYAVIVLASTDGTTEIPGSPRNIFVRDTCTGAPSGCQPSVTLASVGLNSSPSDGDSISPSISADGRYVVFLSTAMNLVDSDTNGVADVFVRDTCAGAASGCQPSTQRVSIAADGSQIIDASVSASITATGRYVTFETAAPGQAGTSPGAMFLRDTCAGAASACTPTTAQIQ